MEFLITSILFLFTLTGFGQMANLEVNVSNIEEGKGQLIISVYNDPTTFPIEGKEWKSFYVPITDTNKATLNIELPNGDYAIALLHDTNVDGECNFNFIGIPTEAYGFSQNVRPLIKVPNFEETMFHIDGKKSIEIELIQ